METNASADAIRTTSTDGVPPSRRDVWVGMLLYPRHTLPTAAAPVIVASALAAHAHVFSFVLAMAALLAGWFIQLGGVIADNYNNLVRHGDDREHADFVRALKAGVVSLRELKLTVVGCFAFAALVGLYLISAGGLPVLVIGVSSAVAALAYSTGPFPLGDHGLGDVLFFIFFGVVSVGGTYYVQAARVLAPFAWHTWAPSSGTITWAALVSGLAVGALTTNILLIDNLRDLEFDREKHEYTLAVLIGPRWTHVEFVALQCAAYLVPMWLHFRGGFGLRVMLPLVSAPYAVAIARRVLRSRTYESLIPMTPEQGQLLLLFSVLLAVGVL
jgi:1,4-dihydroxy-2-naphthoate octaprenyltransferase